MKPNFIHRVDRTFDFPCPGCGVTGKLRSVEAMPEEVRTVDDVFVSITGDKVECSKCLVRFDYYVPEEIRPAGKV